MPTCMTASSGTDKPNSTSARSPSGVPGRVTAMTYEYGNAFLIVAGLLNMLVVLDAFDVAQGRK